jgi:hypothetical protein
MIFDFINYKEIILSLFTIFGGLGGLVLVFKKIKEKFLRDYILKKKIAKLATLTTIDFFKEEFGSAVFVNSNSVEDNGDSHNCFVKSVV